MVAGSSPTLANYQGVLADQSGQLVRWAFNSVFVAIVFTVAYVALCAITAYPLARMRFSGVGMRGSPSSWLR